MVAKSRRHFTDLSFSEKVVFLSLLVPKGQVTTYGDLAKAAGGGALSAQSVTQVLGKAYAKGQKNIPFHRIVYADGRVWLDDGHRVSRLRLYKSEGIELDQRSRVVDFENKRFDFRALEWSSVKKALKNHEQI
jgi:alkylated DNA nucleotide flippase Atl1